MEQFIEKIIGINEPRTIFLLCGAFKFHEVNSSISRDGYIKKIGWVISLLVGYIVDLLVEVNLFLIGSAVVCIATEGISFYENLGEIGIKLPFAKYFAKLKDNQEEKESD